MKPVTLKAEQEITKLGNAAQPSTSQPHKWFTDIHAGEIPMHIK